MPLWPPSDIPTEKQRPYQPGQYPVADFLLGTAADPGNQVPLPLESIINPGLLSAGGSRMLKALQSLKGSKWADLLGKLASESVPEGRAAQAIEELATSYHGGAGPVAAPNEAGARGLRVPRSEYGYNDKTLSSGQMKALGNAVERQPLPETTLSSIKGGGGQAAGEDFGISPIEASVEIPRDAPLNYDERVAKAQAEIRNARQADEPTGKFTTDEYERNGSYWDKQAAQKQVEREDFLQSGGQEPTTRKYSNYFGWPQILEGVSESAANPSKPWLSSTKAGPSIGPDWELARSEELARRMQGQDDFSASYGQGSGSLQRKDESELLKNTIEALRRRKAGEPLTMSRLTPETAAGPVESTIAPPEEKAVDYIDAAREHLGQSMKPSEIDDAIDLHASGRWQNEDLDSLMDKHDASPNDVSRLIRQSED